MCVWWSMRWSVVSVEWSSSCSKAAAMTLPVVRVRLEVAHGRSEVVPVVEKIVAKTAAEVLKSRLTFLRRRESRSFDPYQSTTSTEKFTIQKLNLKAYRHSHPHPMTPTSQESGEDLAWMRVG